MVNRGGHSKKTSRGIEHLGPKAEYSWPAVSDSSVAEKDNEKDNGTLQKLLLTCKEAADALAISQRKLWSMTTSGEIPHIRIGRSVRYPVDELRQWILEQTKGGADR